MNIKLKELYDNRDKVSAEIGKLSAEAMNNEKREAFDKMLADYDVIGADIERYKQAEKVASEQREVAEQLEAVGEDAEKVLADEDTSEQREQANWLNYLSTGELRDTTVTGVTGVVGPTAFAKTLMVKKDSTAVRKLKPMIIPGGGFDNFQVPVWDDLSNSGVLMDDDDDAPSDADPTYTQHPMSPKQLTSGPIPGSLQFFKQFPEKAEAWLLKLAADRIARQENALLTSGSGAGDPEQPQGYVTGSGEVESAAGVNTITYDNVLDLEASVDPYYRDGSKFVMSDDAYKILRKLEDTNGNLIWRAGLESKPSTILSYEYVINNSMQNAGTINNKPLGFGNYGEGFALREFGTAEVIRSEKEIEKGIVRFVVFSWIDSVVISPSIIKVLKVTASS